MTSLLLGIHHVTAIAADPHENLDFYTKLLGLRLVKKTVNFDDPFTYHLYFGDEHGTPGTILTHFPNPRARAGERGSPEITVTTMTVPEGSLEWWTERLRAANAPELVVGPDRLEFEDPHAMRLAIEAGETAVGPGWTGNGVPLDHAITGIGRIAIEVPSVDETIAFLREVLGFADGAETCEHPRLWVGRDAPGHRIEVIPSTAAPGRMGAGTVHHVAWRVADDAVQEQVAERLLAAGVMPTPQQDRDYFRSIYFRIPGGVIFEVATDIPGFAVDEEPAHLGEALRLPKMHEGKRDAIERTLIPLETPSP